MARWTRIVGIFTAALAVLNLPTLFFVGWQAWTAADVAKETRSQLRAVMQLTSIQTIIGVMEETLTPNVGFLSTFQNLGGTRAEKVSGWQSIQYFEGSVPFNADLSKPAKEIEKASPQAVGPNANFQIAPVGLKPAELEKAIKREGIIVIWGAVTYNDIYSPTTPRNIFFCQRVTVGQPQPATSPEKQMVFTITPFRGDCNRTG